ncbi:MAG TPA: XdhC family protein [Oculatellaceae cyanobacterium]
MSLFFSKLNELLQSQCPFVMVTVVDTIGSVPQDVGSKMLVTEEGLFFGTVGGGKVEARAIAEAKSMLGEPVRVLSSSRNRHVPSHTKFWNWSLSKDIGMTCGGSVKMFMEAFHCKPWRITVFGAGHIANALLGLLVKLDCKITCFDTRSEWLERLPESANLTKVCSSDLVGEVEKLPAGDFLLLMTMGHTTDKPVLLEILRCKTAESTPYIGVIGSDAKAIRLRQDVAEAGLGPEHIERFECPMGMAFGTNDPHEIAVSITARLLETRDRLKNQRRSGLHSTERQLTSQQKLSEQQTGMDSLFEQSYSASEDPTIEHFGVDSGS